jgi:hypothetical protein
MQIKKQYIFLVIITSIFTGLWIYLYWYDHPINRIKRITGIEIPFLSSSIKYEEFHSNFAGTIDLYAFKITKKTMNKILEKCKKDISKKVGIFNYELSEKIVTNTLKKTRQELKLGIYPACSEKYVHPLGYWIIIIDNQYVFFNYSHI